MSYRNDYAVKFFLGKRLLLNTTFRFFAFKGKNSFNPGADLKMILITLSHKPHNGDWIMFREDNAALFSYVSRKGQKD
jgi:hypothetical protein